MTIKLALLKSGEEVISDMTEMMSHEQVVGYFFKHPCRAILSTPAIDVDEENEAVQKAVSIKLLPCRGVRRFGILSLVIRIGSIETLFLPNIYI